MRTPAEGSQSRGKLRVGMQAPFCFPTPSHSFIAHAIRHCYQPVGGGGSPSDFYLCSLLASGTAALACVFLGVTVDRFGRRGILLLLMTLTGIASLVLLGLWDCEHPPFPIVWAQQRDQAEEPQTGLLRQDQPLPRSPQSFPGHIPSLFSQSISECPEPTHLAIGSESKGMKRGTRPSMVSRRHSCFLLGPPDLNEAAITTFSVLGLFSSQAAGILSTLLASEVIPTTVR